MDPEQAITRAREVVDGSVNTSVALETYEGLSVAYAYGSQWASAGANGSGGFRLSQLKNIVNADSALVRVTFNEIRARISKVHSRLSPEFIDTSVKPASRAINDQVAALVANERVQLALHELKALGKLGKADLKRLVLGSSILRRCMERGEAVVARDAAGTPLRTGGNETVTLPTTRHYWELLAPHNLIRDPAASDPDFEDEDCVIIEKPRTLDWLKRHFGIDREMLGDRFSTMGQLLEYQNFIRAATGQGIDLYAPNESKTQAVMVGEVFMTGDDGVPWEWYGLTVRNTAATDAGGRAMKWMDINGEPMFGKSPYHGLPIHHFRYDEEDGCPWARGIPWILMQAQDQGNLARTALLRMMLAYSPKWKVMEGSVDEPGKRLGPNPYIPIIIKATPAGLHAVDRVNPTPMDPAMSTIIQNTPDWYDRLLNMSPIQSGISPGKNPEAGKAILARLDQADTVLNQINRRDEETFNEALTGTLFDIVRHEPTAVLHELLSHEFTPDQIDKLKQQDIARSVVGVRAVPGSLRPRTREEIRLDAAQNLQLKMLDPIAARRNLYIQTGERVDEKECRAIDKQTQEIASILDGRESRVLLGEDHDAHIWRLDFEAESVRASQYTEDQQQALMDHRAQHIEAKVIRAQLARQEAEALNGPAANPAPVGAEDQLPPAQPEGQPNEALGGEPYEQPYQDSADFQPVAAGAPEAEPAGIA